MGDYDKFQEVYAMKKSQLEAAYNRQQKEIADLKDFVARNKARVSTRNMAMSRQKKLDKMDASSWLRRSRSRNSLLKKDVLPDASFSRPEISSSVTMSRCPSL